MIYPTDDLIESVKLNDKGGMDIKFKTPMSMSDISLMKQGPTTFHPPFDVSPINISINLD